MSHYWNFLYDPKNCNDHFTWRPTWVSAHILSVTCKIFIKVKNVLNKCCGDKWNIHLAWLLGHPNKVQILKAKADEDSNLYGLKCLVIHVTKLQTAHYIWWHIILLYMKSIKRHKNKYKWFNIGPEKSEKHIHSISYCT